MTAQVIRFPVERTRKPAASLNPWFDAYLAFWKALTPKGEEKSDVGELTTR